MYTLLNHAISITPNDSADIDKPIKRLYCGGAGNLKFVLKRDEDSAAVTIALSAGQTLDALNIRKIFSTGTSATGLIGFY